ncbi:hypothetical protein Lesp02_04690 [Lentzea sp. NBRC 105346]|uniref:hypothetical protein n=1 Tax=Lentzea sp. NBRC 105346 TaxID=3032205 RepID=UPI0024A26D37|nr:hypothetical protein [Lentzea sp. NBRC 105346]GLZ28279.1 hypothetical protein Lesp02_04690 [Lentzea sp. NBRC 105346]
MTFRGFDAELLGGLGRRGATDAQIHLLQRVLRAVEPASLLSQHVSSIPGAASEVPRAHEALLSHAAIGQPMRNLLWRICANAAAVAPPECAAVLADVAADTASNDKQFRVNTAEYAQRLGELLPGIRSQVIERFRAAWKSGDDLSRAADEMACLVAATGRDVTALERALVHAPLDDVIDVLLPPLKRYQVACVVQGVRELVGLSTLEPSARHLTEESRWGPATARLREFLAQVTGCVVGIEVDAVDKPSAGRLARRRVTELLDQYVAGHRLLTITLDPRVLVARVGALDTEEVGRRKVTVRKAHPLVPHWPSGLREGLRMAHLARVTESPLAAAALSWAALEACGVHRRPEKLAAALSLQALRQQVAETHQLVHQSVTAAAKFTGSRSVLRPLTVLAGHAEVDEHRRLCDLNTWVDVLLPSRDRDTPALTAARAALDSLELAPLAAHQVAEWRERLAEPASCAEWLGHTENRLRTLLEALYGARNLTLHAGMFSAADDEVLGQGGLLVVDFTLEFLGNWYRHADGNETPFDIVEQLALRQHRICGRMRHRRNPLYPLDIGRLTSPNCPTGWGRITPGITPGVTPAGTETAPD